MGKELVLITGATGHLGFRTLVLLLQHGYRARIAHRRAAQVDKIQAAASIRPFGDAVEFVLVPDITAADAYDGAIRGVDYVVHVASPILSTVPEGQVGGGLLCAMAVAATDGDGSPIGSSTCTTRRRRA